MNNNPSSWEEKLRDIIIPNAGVAMAWDKAGLKSEDAVAQVTKAVLEMLPEKKEHDDDYIEYVNGYNNCLSDIKNILGGK